MAAPEKDYLAYLQGQRKAPCEDPRIDTVEVDNQTSLPTGLIEAHVDVKPGEKLNMAELRRSIDRIYGIDTFENVDFQLKKKDKSYGIVIKPLEKSWGPNYLRFGLGLEDNFKGTSNYATDRSVYENGHKPAGGRMAHRSAHRREPAFFYGVLSAH